MNVDKLRKFLVLAEELDLTDLETRCFTSPLLRVATQIRDADGHLWDLGLDGTWTTEDGVLSYPNLSRLTREFGPIWPTKID